MEEERVHVWSKVRCMVYIFKKEIWIQDLEKGSTLVYTVLKRGRV